MVVQQSRIPEEAQGVDFKILIAEDGLGPGTGLGGDHLAFKVVGGDEGWFLVFTVKEGG